MVTVGWPLAKEGGDGGAGLAGALVVALGQPSGCFRP
jgi:hypothetical protein